MHVGTWAGCKSGCRDGCLVSWSCPSRCPGLPSSRPCFQPYPISGSATPEHPRHKLLLQQGRGGRCWSLLAGGNNLIKHTQAGMFVHPAEMRREMARPPNSFVQALPSLAVHGLHYGLGHKNKNGHEGLYGGDSPCPFLVSFRAEIMLHCCLLPEIAMCALNLLTCEAHTRSTHPTSTHPTSTHQKHTPEAHTSSTHEQQQ
jgi:hypothetical protein